MKKFLFVICTLLFIGCGNETTVVSVQPEVPVVVTPKPLYTYVVEHEGKIDTIIAENYLIGNFVGYGKSIHFYIDMEKVATILIPKSRELTVKTIK